jgi:hypothetical protein
MRSEDLIPVFVTTLKQLDHRKEYTGVIEEGKEIIEKEKWNDDTTIDYLYEDLWNALDSFSLPYTYFGVHPGNGSDYGFWVYEYLEEEYEELRVEDLSEIPRNYQGYVLLIVNGVIEALYYNVVTDQIIVKVWSV